MRYFEQDAGTHIDNNSHNNEDFNVGKILRQIRKEKGMTVDDVAEQVGVSKSFISKLERNITQASVATLLKVCQVVGIEPAKLFERPKTTFVRNGEGIPFSMGGEKMQEYLVSDGINDDMMVLMSNIEPKGGSGSESYTLKADADMVHVISGSLSITVSDETYHLEEGDTLTFDPSLPHQWINPSETTACRAIWVIVPPPKGNA